jgi:CubicO group peptidase (beta-lactamase class C family)
MDKGDVTGLSIALVDDQKIVWAQGFGYADKAHKRPATAETLYRVGSISKLFTATATMQLAEQGKLDIDKPLRTYVPEFSVKPRVGNLEITPRNIMTHHSGLPRDYLSGMWTSQPIPFSALVAKLDAESAAYPPEYLFSYSNIGVSLLGHAVQNVSGQAFEQYMQENVLNPIGMANSSFSSRVAKESLMSQGYRDNKLANEPALRDVPAGGLNTNVLDLSRFLSMVFADGKVGEQVILKSTTLHEMLQAQNEGIALDLNFQIGLGWMLSGLGDIAIENAGKVIHHAGSTFMFHSQMIALPDHKLGVVVLSNSATSAPAVNKVAVEALKLALQAKTGIKSDPPPKLIVSEEKIDDETARSFAGDYATMLGYVHVDRRGEDLRANAAGTTFTLVPRKNGTLGVHYVLLGFIPISLGDEIERIGLLRRNIAGRDVLVAQIGKQQMLVGEKIKPVPLSEKWQHRLGEYEVANLNGDESMIEHFELTQENGFLLSEISLTLQPGMTYRLPIIPVTDSKANVATMLHDYGETVNVVTNNGEEQLQFAGYVLQKKRIRRSNIDDSFKSRRE